VNGERYRPARLVGTVCGALLLAASLGVSLTAGAQEMSLSLLPMYRKGEARELVPKAKVKTQLREALPNAELVELEDERYFVVTRAWIEEMQGWLAAYVDQRLGPERGKAYLFDRPNQVARLFSSVAGLSTEFDRNARGQPLVGVSWVECGKILSQQPGDGHLCYFVIFGTAEGFHLLEPSTGKIERVMESAIRDHIRAVMF
jgi:hypothetical protein